MRLERNYQLGWISRRSEVKVIHAKQVFGNVKVLCMCPITYGSRHIRISGVCKDKNAVVMEVGVCKCKHDLKVSQRTLIPLRNIRR